MKRLFMIRIQKKGPPWRDENGRVAFFETKEAAKRVRDQLNLPRAVVSNGPDHKKCVAIDARAMR